MDFHYELLEETRKEIRDIQFFREDVEINAEEYEVIHDYDEAYENAFDGEYGELEGQTWVDIIEDNMAEVRGIIYEHDNYAELDKIVHDIKIPELKDIAFPIDAQRYSIVRKKQIYLRKGKRIFREFVQGIQTRRLAMRMEEWKNNRIRACQKMTWYRFVFYIEMRA